MRKYFLMTALACVAALTFASFNVTDVYANKKGKKAFKKNGCAACHFKDKGENLKPYPSKQQLGSLDYDTFKKTVAEGKPGTMMKAFPKIKEKDMKALHEYLQTFK